MKPASYYYPQDKDGPIAPWWWYSLRGKNQRWLLVAIVELSWVGLAVLHGASHHVWEWTGYVIYFLLGIQIRGTWQRVLEYRKSRVEHEMHMGWFDRYHDIREEALENGYSYTWMRMRQGPDPEWLRDLRRS